MTTNREENMSDARPATPAEAPRHDPRCELGNPGIRRTAEPICTCGAASAGVSAARLRNRMQEIQARVDNAIFSKIDPDVPYLLAELKTLTDALASAIREVEQLQVTMHPDYNCDFVALEDVLTILRRAEKEQPKQPNPCPQCGTYLWADPRPCWYCARRAEGKP